MKSFIVLAALFAMAVAGPVDTDQQATVLKSENNNIGVDNWSWR